MEHLELIQLNLVTVTLIGVGSSANLTATDGVGEIRKVVKVAVRGSGKTHISEVQIVGDF
ncbi:MAG: hypothetical protein CM15mV32_1080 [Caudoviricetes sp.]|nr:MAG: hypothetical protein CM15mV32_1080 [Caudoviricetes sp.]